MKKWIAAFATILVLASVGSLAAHHSLSQFDETTAVRVKGVIILFERVNPHSVLFVDQKGADGRIQRWAVDGPGILQLKRGNISIDALKPGDVIEVCGYVTKEGVEPQRTLFTEPLDYSLKAPKSISGRRITGEVLVMPDGRQEKWLDYGAHKCLGSNFKDMHL